MALIWPIISHWPEERHVARQLTPRHWQRGGSIQQTSCCCSTFTRDCEAGKARIQALLLHTRVLSWRSTLTLGVSSVWEGGGGTGGDTKRGATGYEGMN